MMGKAPANKKGKPSSAEAAKAEAEKPERKSQVLNSAQIGAIFGKSERWASMLIHDQWIKKDDNGNVTIITAARGIAAYYEDRMEAATKSAAAKRATEARAREIEMRIDERERTLIPLEDALGYLAEVAAINRAEWAGFPARYTRDMTERRKLEQAVDEALTRMAAKAAAAATSLQSGNSDMEAVT